MGGVTFGGHPAYNRVIKILWCIMKKMIGFAAFFIAIGMLIMLITHNRLIGLVIIALLLFFGYNCFCDD